MGSSIELDFEDDAIKSIAKLAMERKLRLEVFALMSHYDGFYVQSTIYSKFKVIIAKSSGRMKNNY